MENKNVVVAVILMLVVWMGYSFLFPPPAAPPAAPANVAPAAEPVAAATVVPELPADPVVPSTAEQPVVRELTVETDLYRATFSSSGARLKTFELKAYKLTADPDSPSVDLLEAGAERLSSLRTTGNEGFSLAADALYSVSVDDAVLQVAPGESRQVVFRSFTPSGLLIEKIFTFRGGAYDFDYRLQVVNAGSVPTSGRLSLALIHPWDETHKGGRLEFVGPATLAADKVHTDKVDDLAKEARSYRQDVVWSGYESKYFMGAVVPLGDAAEQVSVQKNGAAIENVFVSPSRSLQPGERFTLEYLLYFGPKDLDILKTVDHQLAQAIDFGFFRPIARPLLTVLKFFYSFIGNYGVAIILLTAIIKALFWPLTQKSYSSMKAMQKLQPEMQRLKEKFKNDRERLNRETMELYKTHRVNPLGGCLPMLVQIPVFFALYKVLLDAIELRHAPFGFWLTDLSAKDPYYVTPLVMGATMFIQQKMTPSTMDPNQAKMFMIMPVVFTFLFLNFPSGLVIYWLVNNVLTIAQQYFINRKVS